MNSNFNQADGSLSVVADYVSKKTNRSSAWDYFKVISEEGQKLKVKCKCGCELSYCSQNGTSSMNRHWDICKVRTQELSNVVEESFGKDQSIIMISENGICCRNTYHYSEERANKALEELFIAEELPFML